MEELLERITSHPGILGGKPVIRGTRLSVEFVLERLSEGETAGGLQAEYQGLEDADIRACLAFARSALSSLSFAPLPTVRAA